jgi:hypothetical protein
MVSPSVSLWYDRAGKCISCGRTVFIEELRECPNCHHEFSPAELEIIASRSKRPFKKSAVIGLAFFLLVFGVAIVLHYSTST